MVLVLQQARIKILLVHYLAHLSCSNSGLKAQSIIYRSKTSELPDFSKGDDGPGGEVFFDVRVLSFLILDSVPITFNSPTYWQKMVLLLCLPRHSQSLASTLLMVSLYLYVCNSSF